MSLLRNPYNVTGIVYGLSLIGASILLLKGYNFRINTGFYIFYISFTLMSILGIYSVYKSDRIIVNIFISIICPLVLFGSAPQPVMLIPMTGFIPLVLLSKYSERLVNGVKTWFYIIIVIEGIMIIGGYNAHFSDWKPYNEYFSPDGKYFLEAALTHDYKAGSGQDEIGIRLVRQYFGFVLKSKKMIYFGPVDYPSIKWLDNKNIEIKGKRINIDSSELWINT